MFESNFEEMRDDGDAWYRAWRWIWVKSARFRSDVRYSPLAFNSQARVYNLSSQVKAGNFS